MVITSLILSALALALSMWMGRRNPVRSSGLTAGMLVLLMLAPLLLWVPKIHLDIDLPWMNAVEPMVVSSTGEAVANSSWNVMMVLLWVYGLIATFLIVRIGCHYVVSKHWRSEAISCDDEAYLNLLGDCAEQLQLAKLPDLRFSENVDSPVITGLMKPVLLLPMTASEWSEETLKMVMLHELGHVKRRDLWTSLASQVACALHWFNPLVWMLRKRLTHECEYACDAHVISSGAHPGNYINALCDVAETCHDQKLRQSSTLGFSAALAMANQASLKNRVANLLEKRPGVNRVNTVLVMVVLGASASAVLAINLVRTEVLVKPISIQKKEIVKEVTPVDEKEVELRLSANPFPGDE